MAVQSVYGPEVSPYSLKMKGIVHYHHMNNCTILIRHFFCTLQNHIPYHTFKIFFDKSTINGLRLYDYL